MDLAALITACIEAKRDNKEFALLYAPGGLGPPWQAHIGNPSSHVPIGEIGGQVQATGNTPEQAVTNLLRALRQRKAG